MAMGLTEQERKKARSYALQGAEFMFIASPVLCNMIALGSIETAELNESLLVFLLEKRPIRIDSEMVIKYCEHTLDSKNTWLLDHGDIKVVPKRFEIKTKENGDGDRNKK